MLGYAGALQYTHNTPIQIIGQYEIDLVTSYIHAISPSKQRFKGTHDIIGPCEATNAPLAAYSAV